MQNNVRAQENIKALKQALLPYKGGNCPVFIDYQQQDTKVRLNLGVEWKVKLVDKLLDELSKLLGENNIKVSYRD